MIAVILTITWRIQLRPTQAILDGHGVERFDEPWEEREEEEEQDVFERVDQVPQGFAVHPQPRDARDRVQHVDQLGRGHVEVQGAGTVPEPQWLFGVHLWWLLIHNQFVKIAKVTLSFKLWQTDRSQLYQNEVFNVSRLILQLLLSSIHSFWWTFMNSRNSSFYHVRIYVSPCSQRFLNLMCDEFQNKHLWKSIDFAKLNFCRISPKMLRMLCMVQKSVITDAHQNASNVAEIFWEIPQSEILRISADIF